MASSTSEFHHESAFSTVLDAVRIPILVHDEKTIAYANEATCRGLRARSCHDLIGIPLETIVHPDGMDAGRERRRVMLNQGHAFAGVNIKLLDLDGNPLHVVVQARKFLVGNRSYIVVIVPGDHQPSEWSAPLGAGVLAFPEGTSLAEATLRALPHPVYVTDQERIRMASHAGALMLGAGSAAELEGTSIAAHVHPDTRDAAAERRSVLIESGISISRVSSKLLRADGNPIYVELEARPVPGDEGPLGVWWVHSTLDARFS